MKNELHVHFDYDNRDLLFQSFLFNTLLPCGTIHTTDEEALQNAVIDLNIEQDCATDSDEDSIDEQNDSASSVNKE